MSDAKNNSAALCGKHLHLDCFAGVAGDMFLGAMLDLGVPEQLIRDGLAKLALGDYELRVGRTARNGIVGCDIQVHVEAGGEPGHHHRTWRSIREMIEASGLAGPVKQRAVELFSWIARAEARLHGTEVDQVAFHEVGAVDSIVDVVGAALALDYLSPARVTSRPVPLGHGFTRCAHGVLPVPSPAAVEILARAGAVVEDGGAAVELCTPTGAAIVAGLQVEAFGPIPPARVLAAGYGVGDTLLEDRPNLLRLLLFEPEPADPAELEAVVVEANVDNMTPEWCGHLMERLFAAGARDVWYTPILMKKGRPALTVSALCPVAAREGVGGVLLSESTTIGLRYHAVGRRVLGRRTVEVDTPYGQLVVKVAADGDRVLNATPEFEVCKAAADRLGVPLKEVYGAALAAYRSLAGSDGSR